MELSEAVSRNEQLSIGYGLRERSLRAVAVGAMAVGSILGISSEAAASTLNHQLSNSKRADTIRQSNCDVANGVSTCYYVEKESASHAKDTQSVSVKADISTAGSFLLDTHLAFNQRQAAAKGECFWITASNKDQIWTGGWYDGQVGHLGWRQEPKGAQVDVCRDAKAPGGYIKVGERHGLDSEYGIKNTDCGNPVKINTPPPESETYDSARIVDKLNFIATATETAQSLAQDTLRIVVHNANDSCVAAAEASGRAYGKATISTTAKAAVRSKAISQAENKLQRVLISAGGSLNASAMTKAEGKAFTQAEISQNVSAKCSEFAPPPITTTTTTPPIKFPIPTTTTTRPQVEITFGRPVQEANAGNTQQIEVDVYGGQAGDQLGIMAGPYVSPQNEVITANGGENVVDLSFTAPAVPSGIQQETVTEFFKVTDLTAAQYGQNDSATASENILVISQNFY